MFKHYHLHKGCKQCEVEQGACGESLFYIKDKKLLYRECYCCLNTCIIIDGKNILFSIPQNAVKICYKYYFDTATTISSVNKEKEWWDLSGKEEDFFDQKGNLLPLGEGLGKRREIDELSFLFSSLV